MKVLRRPPRPAPLADSTDSKHERARAVRHFEVEGRLDGFEFDLYADAEVRAALAEMSYGKCAYCESYYDATAPQDVEHYRPKGRIDIPGGRLKPGYWWLASKWENLLPSCIHCNREKHHELQGGGRLKTGKGGRFPLADETARARARNLESRETPLLIDPCAEDPSKYLQFVDEHGESIVRPLAADTTSLDHLRARTSIDVYGLNRAGLVLERSRFLKRLKQSLGWLQLWVDMIDAAPLSKRDKYERLFLEEVAMIRAHVSGRDGYAALAAPLASATFQRLGLRL